MHARTSLLAVLLLMVVPGVSPAQILVPDQPLLRHGIHVPHHPIRPIPRPASRPVPVYRIRAVNVQADLNDQMAKVRMSQIFQNMGSATLEAQFLFPLPADAAVSELTLLCDGKELPGKLLGKEEARRIYEDIVRRQRDPALLEFVGGGLYRTSVFPIPPNAERTVEIRYTQLLKKTGGLVDLLLPLGTFKHANHAIDTLNVSFRIETSAPIKTIYSPTHSVNVVRADDHHATGKLTLNNVTEPDDLRIFCGTQADAVGMSLLSYRPNDKEDGYFMLLASPELKVAQNAAAAKTALIVVDRSGSMSGPKIDQVRQAVKFLVQQLKPADTFNIVAYDSEVEAFRPELQRVTADTVHAALGFADGLNAGGGTNIDGALKTALGMLTDDKRPCYLMFLTDGVPTVGEQNEMKIVAAARAADKVHVRMFNLGVGYDVNSRLVDRLSRELNGQSLYVRPNENIETHVSTLAKTIGSPLLTNVDVKFEFDVPVAAGAAQPISRTYPRKLTDLFAGEQLVWVGRYRQAGAVKISLSGDLAGKRQTYTLTAKLSDRSVGESSSFVEKIWATRRIGEIIDEIDLNGKSRELTDELVKLSMKHGILTPYTSFLADEHVDLADPRLLYGRATDSLDLLYETAGAGGFHQRVTKAELRGAQQLKSSGMSDLYSAPAPAALATANYGYGGAVRLQRGNVAAVPASRPSEKVTARKSPVLSVGTKTFYWKNNQWRDADVSAEAEKGAIRIKQFSDEYFALASQDHGKFAKYVALDGPVILVLDGKTYLIEAAAIE